MNSNINIAIDGPAGAGKSTVAKKVADKLSFLYIDTGAMYRALTYFALSEGIDIHNGHQLKEGLDNCSIKLIPSISGTVVYVNGKDVTEAIRTNEVTQNVSIVASHKEVRAVMLEQQREMAKLGGVVLDGRDIGTHVLPDAEVKIFLTASVEERAKRRHEENVKKGYSSSLEKLIEEIKQRDELDSTREVAPLKKADDAIELDTTSMTINEVVDEILEVAKERV